MNEEIDLEKKETKTIETTFEVKGAIFTCVSSKCPECNGEISHFDVIETGEMHRELWLCPNYKLNEVTYYDKEFIADKNINLFICPICHKTITTDRDIAIKILNYENTEVIFNE